MPSTARSSRGCATCRRRKIRCDRAPGTCQNCTKSKYECPGYSNEDHLVFRSENGAAQAQVERRVAARARQRLQPQTQHYYGSILLNTSAETDHSFQVDASSLPIVLYSRAGPLAPELPLAADIDEHALAFYSRNFRMAGSLNYKQPHPSTRSANYPLLQDAMDCAMKAVSLASMSTFTHTPRLAAEAQKRYGSAVKKINSALQKPDLLRDDLLLSAVLTLNAFESVGGLDAQSIVDWTSHAFGAATLVEMRGVGQFSSPVGLPMLISAVALVMVGCTRDRKPFPEGLETLARRARPLVEKEPEYWDYLLIKIRLVRIWTQSLASPSLLSNAVDPETTISEALQIDKEIVHIFDNSPAHFAHRAFHKPELEEFSLDGRCDVYTGHLVAQMWSVTIIPGHAFEITKIAAASGVDIKKLTHILDMRITRIMIHGVVRLCLAKLQSTSSSAIDKAAIQTRFERSRDIVFEMQAGIMASVPQHLGKIGCDGQVLDDRDTPLFNFPWQAFKARTYQPDELIYPESDGSPVLRTFGGSALGWALFTAAKVHGTDAGVYNKIRSLLRMVGKPQGSHQAHVLADILRHEEAWF